MNLKFKELENLKEKLEYQNKFNYLYSAIQEDLAIKSNILSCEPNWEETTLHLIKVSQQLKSIQEIIIKKEERTSTSLNVKTKINSNNICGNQNNNNKTRNNYNQNQKGNYYSQNQKRNTYYDNNKSRNYNNNNQQNKLNKNNIKCWNCGRFGHFSDECRFKDNSYKNNNKRNKNQQKRNNYNRGRHHINKIQCKNAEVNNVNKNYIDKHEEYFFEDYNDSYNFESNNIFCNYSKNLLPMQKLKYYTCSNSSEDKKNNKNDKNKLNAWTLDSGTTYHMTGDLECLSNITKFNKRIYFANGENVKSKFIGTYKGYINDNKINLKNVLYIPVFKRNLISIDCLSDQYFKTIFQKINNKNNVTIYNKNNNKIYSTSANESRTYTIWTSKRKIEFTNNSLCNNISSESEKDDNMNTWHRRLGHFNINSLKNILSKIENKNKCKICAHSKLRNFPFHTNERRASEPFERVHMDTVSLKQSSLYGNKCFLTILDDYSRYGWVIFCKSKSEVFNIFLNWYNRVKNIFNKTIKYLHSDNGTEL